MFEKKRARRRRDLERMKRRVERYAKQLPWRGYDQSWITPRYIGRAAAMHGTHHCQMCRTYRKRDGAPIAERRREDCRLETW